MTHPNLIVLQADDLRPRALAALAGEVERFAHDRYQIVAVRVIVQQVAYPTRNKREWVALNTQPDRP